MLEIGNNTRYIYHISILMEKERERESELARVYTIYLETQCNETN